MTLLAKRVLSPVVCLICLIFIFWRWESPDPLLQGDNVARKKSLLDVPRSTPHVATEFRWSGGGVSGASEGEENFNLDTNVHVTLLREFETSLGIPAATFKSFNMHRNVTAFVNFFTFNVALNTNPDCAHRLHPNYQLLCHVWAAQQHSNDKSSDVNYDNDTTKRSSLFKGNALHSMCSLFLACSEWKRGRYSIPLSNELLQSTFDKLVHGTKLLKASASLLRNLIHGGNNWREYDWLADRVQISRELLEGSSPIDVRMAFQGGEITMRKKIDANETVTQLFSSRNNGETQHHLTRPLSALETIAVLHHRATAGKMQMVVFPLAEKFGAPGDATECRVPAINVLLFSGDSIAHQMFMRLLDLIRHGPQGQVLVPYGTELLKSKFRHWPTHDRSRSNNIVLAVYPTYDEFLTFQSLLPFSEVKAGKSFVPSNDTVTAYFTAVGKRRAALFCDSQQITSTDSNKRGTLIEQDTEALFYLVFFPDVITSRPRTDALAPCVPAQPILGEFPPKNVHNYDFLKAGASRGFTLVNDPSVPSLRALGIRIPMHVISANMWEWNESPNTYEWLMRMATANCSVMLPATTNSVAAMSLGGADWRFGEHPTSDMTHLYRASTILRLPAYKSARRRYCLHTFKKPSRRKPFLVGPHTGPRELARLETPFRWLHDAVTNVIGSDPMKKLKQNSWRDMEEGKHHRLGMFYSRLRVLDMGKVFLATGNVFHQADGQHERCGGSHWLVGAALYKDTTRVLRTSAESLTREVSKIVPTARRKYSLLSFDDTDDCHGLGTLLTLNALLLDIVHSASKGSESLQK